MIDLEELAKHNTVDDDHDWGYQVRVVNEKEYCGKFLVLEKDVRGSLHYHKLKKETFIVLQGTLYVAIFDESAERESHFIEPGGSLTLERLTRHVMQGANFPVNFPVIVLEVSTHDSDDDTYYLDY